MFVQREQYHCLPHSEDNTISISLCTVNVDPTQIQKSAFFHFSLNSPKSISQHTDKHAVVNFSVTRVENRILAQTFSRLVFGLFLAVS